MILKKIKENGLKWFFWRLKREIVNPSHPLIRAILDGMLKVWNRWASIGKEKQNEDILYTIFDLKVAPITFNISEFLLDSEFEANKSGKSGFVVIFVPGVDENEYGWKEYDEIVDTNSKLWRFHNIVLPITLLAPKCKGVYILPNRSSVSKIVKDHTVYPNTYDGVNIRYIDIVDFYRKLDKPGKVSGLCATKQGLRYIEDWITRKKINRPIVSITLRQSDFDPTRNNKIKEWVRFCDYLKKEGYCPVIVPDTDHAFNSEELFPEIIVFKECSWNMGLRIALYETSYLNYFVPSGPSLLAASSKKISYIAMNMLPQGSEITTREAYKKIGLPIGENYKWAWPNQKMVYEPDTFENILAEFKSFIEENKHL